MRRSIAALAGWLTVAGLAAQGAGTLQFRGSAALGEVVEASLSGGPPGAPGVLLLAPEIGSLQVPGFVSDCLSTRAGLLGLDLPLNGLGAARLTLPVPQEPPLIGVYLASQGVVLAGGALVGSNCASFAVVADSARPSILETFDTAVRHAPEFGAALWAGDRPGIARPGRVGGSGRLGSFDPDVGTLRDGVRVFSTDNQTFPASQTLRGVPLRVTDGRFEFLDFVVPAGVTVRFEGAHPARIHVAGDVQIDGTLDVGGVDLLPADGDPALEAGVPGGAPGPGGGAGGAGGDLPTLVGGDPAGRSGADLVPLPGAVLDGQVTGTGGVGSVAWPVGADPAAVVYRFLGLYSNQFAGGGGGGGFVQAGGAGLVLAERAPRGDTGPAGTGGRAVTVTGSAFATRDDQLVGGAGGGGGGCHAYDSVIGSPRFVRGEAGAGGGGALLLVAGRDLTIGVNGWIRADGGAGAARTELDGAFLAPGGGGSGGSLLLQAGRSFRNDGLVSALGGVGGRTEDLRQTPGTRVAGGDGAPGRVRVEVPDPARDAVLGTIEPASGVGRLGPLADVDATSVLVSTWIPLPAGADPALADYELYAVQDAVSVVYSDRLGFGTGPARSGASPIVLFTRFAELDPFGEPVPGAVGTWSEGTGVAPATANAVRFALSFDRRGFSDLRGEAVRLSF